MRNTYLVLLFEIMTYFGGLSLNETCEVDQQCSGTEKANTCSSYGESQSTCKCNYGYIEKQSGCYRSKTSQNDTIILHHNLLTK